MLLKTNNISFSYSSTDEIFTGINLQIKEGEIISIVGPSGTGKSTLLSCLAGLLQINKGEILFEGEKVRGPEEKLMAGHEEITIVHQLFELDLNFTVRENLSNQMHHLSLSVREKFIEELLEIFDLQDLTQKKSKEISGGEQQRLAMACALAKEPKLLLLDEPFVHLDVHLSKSIGNYLRKLSELRKMSVILVTHNGAEALSWSDRILFMHEGKIKRMYTPEKAYQSPKTLFEGRFFGELNSIYIKDKQFLFRPRDYSLKATQAFSSKLDVQWEYSLFKGAYYANYFKLDNGKEIVLYANNKLNDIAIIYV